MKKYISFIILACMMLTMMLSLTSCDAIYDFLASLNPPSFQGVKLSEYVIVYDEDGLDYNKRAAEYIRDRAKKNNGITLKIVDDDTPKNEHEIVVGETNRDISKKVDPVYNGLQFSIYCSEGSVALEGDYFVIAAAAYYFMDSYIHNGYDYSIVEDVVHLHDPIVKEAKNFIMLIGDGMGVYQTKLFEYMENNVEYGDGEDLFYGYMLPYQGTSRTKSLSGVTDSAAGGTALACGQKTYNEYVGLDQNQNSIKSLTELASEMGMAGAVMSTENKTGATPAAFSSHAYDRDSTAEILTSQTTNALKYGIVIDCGYDYYTAKQMANIEKHIEDTLGKVSADEDGFFLMYEEAYTDKHCHNNNMEKTFQALVRFNQAIARFMEFAFYNPDTFVLITADHETGMLLPGEDGKLHYNHDDHTDADVLIFAYGKGAELFDGVNVENIQIAHTIAALMGEDNFGDQSEYKSLTK